MRSLVACFTGAQQILFPLALIVLQASSTGRGSALDEPTQTKASLETTQADIRKLEMGKPIEREIAPRQVHSYELELQARDYVHITVSQNEMDVVVIVLDPDGKQLMEVDHPSELQPETVKLVANAGGRYQLMVEPFKAALKPARYAIRLIELREATEEDRILQAAIALSGESLALSNNGDYTGAAASLEHALEIREKLLGRDHIEVAQSLFELGKLYERLSYLGRAIEAEQRAVAIRENLLGPEHPEVAECLAVLGGIYQNRGDYPRAERMQQRVFAIYEKAFGSESSLAAAAAYALGMLYTATGDFQKAEQMHLRALAIREKTHGPDHWWVGWSVGMLGATYYVKGDYAKAEPYLRRAVAISERVWGDSHPETATAISNLANVHRVQGEYQIAESLYLKSLAINTNLARAESRDTSYTLKNLALLYEATADYEKAEQFLQRAISIAERVLGSESPEVALFLSLYASLLERKGEIASAIQSRVRSNEVAERNIVLNLASGSERQKLLYLATLAEQTNATISLHARSALNDRNAQRLALLTTLRRKGRVLDAMADSMAALRRRSNSQDRDLLDRLTDTRSRLAAVALRGQRRTNELAHLEEQVEKLETEISLRSAEFRTASRSVALAAVQQAIPSDAALVEYAIYRPFNKNDATHDEQRRYVAYVVHNQGEPQCVELGEAEAIDSSIDALRKALSNPGTSDTPRGPRVSGIQTEDVKRLARAVDEKVMRPVRRSLRGTRNVLISPDGPLNLIPFAALVDEHNRWLVERYTFIYLTTGRDLLRFQEKITSKQGPILIGNPAYDDEGTESAQKTSISHSDESRRSSD